MTPAMAEILAARAMRDRDADRTLIGVMAGIGTNLAGWRTKLVAEAARDLAFVEAIDDMRGGGEPS